MLEDKLETMKTELKSVLDKELELERALHQTRELKFKYLGAIEAFEQVVGEDSLDDKSKAESGEVKKKDVK